MYTIYTRSTIAAWWRGFDDTESGIEYFSLFVGVVVALEVVVAVAVVVVVVVVVFFSLRRCVNAANLGNSVVWLCLLAALSVLVFSQSVALFLRIFLLCFPVIYLLRRVSARAVRPGSHDPRLGGHGTLWSARSRALPNPCRSCMRLSQSDQSCWTSLSNGVDRLRYSGHDAPGSALYRHRFGSRLSPGRPDFHRHHLRHHRRCSIHLPYHTYRSQGTTMDIIFATTAGAEDMQRPLLSETVT